MSDIFNEIDDQFTIFELNSNILDPPLYIEVSISVNKKIKNIIVNDQLPIILNFDETRSFVKNSSGQDVTKYFKISIDNNNFLTAASINNDFSYIKGDDTLTFTIKTK